jgi:predicted acylesterase/phospholipase RssA
LLIWQQICLRSNFGGTESAHLYSETYFGTKDVVQDYLEEVEASLSYIRTHEGMSIQEKQAFYRTISRHYGSTALCLSGGATLGYYHVGVAKALLDQDLLPRVVSGTSAGALVAALICCRTNEELKSLLVPELANKLTALEDDFKTWSKRFWKTGARFDAVDWARKAMWVTMGNMTFKEAFERTGRCVGCTFAGLR